MPKPASVAPSKLCPGFMLWEILSMTESRLIRRFLLRHTNCPFWPAPKYSSSSCRKRDSSTPLPPRSFNRWWPNQKARISFRYVIPRWPDRLRSTDPISGLSQRAGTCTRQREWRRWWSRRRLAGRRQQSSANTRSTGQHATKYQPPTTLHDTRTAATNRLSAIHAIPATDSWRPVSDATPSENATSTAAVGIKLQRDPSANDRWTDARFSLAGSPQLNNFTA